MRASVVIVGAGPTGLMLAIELGRRGVSTLVISEPTETCDSPKATVTQARTMEHFRRLGIAERVRSTGVPGDHPTDIVYCTRIGWHEIARHRMPSPDEARQLVRSENSHTPELTHRSCQMWIEPILLDEVRRWPSVELLLGWRVERFSESGDEVTVEATREGVKRSFIGSYLVGCDGATSMVRSQLEIGMGDSSSIKEFKGRPMVSVHARAPKLHDAVPFAKGWLYAAINTVQRGSCISLNGDEFKFNFWRPDEWTSDDVTKPKIAEIHQRMFGREVDFDVIGYKLWKGGASLVADGYRRSRVFIAGDAAHLFTPSAGLGYCTGIDGAANLGWKLAAVVKRWGGPALLDSYEIECRPEALRRTRFAADCAERLAIFKPTPALELNTPEGAGARALAAEHFAKHLPFQYDIPGINFGARFDESPIIASDRSEAPPQSPNVYQPSAKPGGRAPHAWLPDGRSIFDTFGTEFTLLQLGSIEVTPPSDVPIKVVKLDGLRDRYQADLVLVRPDQVIAWRGSELTEAVLRRVTGW